MGVVVMGKVWEGGGGVLRVQCVPIALIWPPGWSQGSGVSHDGAPGGGGRGVNP